MNNFLTGTLLILIVLKAKQLVPHVLILIPIAYILGSLRMRLSDVTMESAFNGQYMMWIYLVVSLTVATIYIITRKLENLCN